MKTVWLATAALVTVVGLGLPGCGDAPEPDEAAVEAPRSLGKEIADAPSAQSILQQRLIALDYFASTMWPAARPDAALVWLRESAAEHGLTLTREIPEPVAMATSVATRRIGVRAEGDWLDVRRWLTAIEASPQRIVAREIGLNRLRDRVVADLKLTALMDLPAGLTALGEADLTELDPAGMAELIALIDADLEEKGRTLNRLGADVSWSQPIEKISEALPEGATPVRLALSRGDTGDRARRFTGSFTVQLPDAATVDPMLAQLAGEKGFAQVRGKGVKGVGASFVRASAAFIWGAPEPVVIEVETDARPRGAAPIKNPF